MPKIIRSTGVYIERAKPIVMAQPKPAPGQPQDAQAAQSRATQEAQAARARAEMEMEALIRAAEDEKRREMERIHASAEIIVEEIIERARDDADNMLVNAREETVKVLQEAVREGREQGMGQAIREMHEMQAAAQRRIDEAVQALMDERGHIVEELERDILELVFDIAEKVLEVQMDRSSEWITAMVKTALAQMEGDGAVVMKVAVEARQKVSGIAENLFAAAGKAGNLAIVADSSLPRGGCVIDTGRGVIDTGVEGKFGRLKAALRENA